MVVENFCEHQLHGGTLLLRGKCDKEREDAPIMAGTAPRLPPLTDTA